MAHYAHFGTGDSRVWMQEVDGVYSVCEAPDPCSNCDGEGCEEVCHWTGWEHGE